MKNMLVWGDFTFSVSDGTPYEGLQRVTDGGFTSVKLYGRKPLTQFSGQALETITVSGTWHYASGMDKFNELRRL